MKLKQWEPWWHGCQMLKHLRDFWMQSHLCDVVIKSDDGREHFAHRNVLSAASKPMKNLLSGDFIEGTQMKSGQPVHIAASGNVVSAMIDHIYGGEPVISTSDAMELLRLAGAYHMTDLVSEIESELQASLDSDIALQLLQQIHTLGLTLTDLRQACEEEIARDFERCVERDSFCFLGAAQLARILAREDLWVPREEVVMRGLFRWVKTSSDRGDSLGILLQHIDFASLSMQNLDVLSQASQGMGQHGFELQYSVDEAKQLRIRRNSWNKDHEPKRQCLQFWSPELGACPRGFRGGQWVGGDCNQYSSEEEEDTEPRSHAVNFCWHQGNFYIADGRRLVRWGPGCSQGIVVVNENLTDTAVAVSPTGQIFLADSPNSRLLTLRDGQLQEVLHMDGLRSVCVTPNGTIYLLGCTEMNLGWVCRMEHGAPQHVVSSQDLMSKFNRTSVFVRMCAQGEVLYILGWHMEDDPKDFILKVSPDGAEPVIVGRGGSSDLRGLYVTECGKIYCADAGPVGQILTFNPGERTALKVLDNAQRFWYDKPVDVLVKDTSLFVLYQSGLVYQYDLPRKIQLD